MPDVLWFSPLVSVPMWQTPGLELTNSDVGLPDSILPPETDISLQLLKSCDLIPTLTTSIIKTPCKGSRRKEFNYWSEVSYNIFKV